jgi:hypothetical protein
MLVYAAGRALGDTIFAGDSFYDGGQGKGDHKGLGFGGYVKQATNKAITFGWDAKNDKMSDVIT